MKITVSIIALLVTASTALCSPEEPPNIPGKEAIMAAFDLMEAADTARQQKNHPEAMTLYGKALDAYMLLARDYPGWQTNLVRFRIAYCRDQLKALLGLAGGTQPPPAAVSNITPPRVSADTSTPSSILEPRVLPPLVPPGTTNITPSPGTNTLTQITSRAKVLLSEGKFVQARLLLMEGIVIDPDHYLVRLLLGVAQCEAAKFDDAALLLKQLADENPTDPHVHIALAGAYLGMGETSNATHEVTTALELKPGMAEAHYNMVQILIASEPLDRELAKYHYGKAIEAGAKPDEKIEALLGNGTDATKGTAGGNNAEASPSTINH